MNTNEICTAVTDRIIAELEKGIIPWEKPWVVTGNGMKGAFNRSTKKPYSLLNQLMLGQPGEYATFKQWNQLGGKIRKGEKTKMVVFWKPLIKEVEVVNEENEVVKVPKVSFVLRYYNVFHIDQVEGVNPLEIPEGETFDNDPIEEADALLRGYFEREGIGFYENGNSAYYAPALDKVVVPPLNLFKKTEEFYSTAFHEATHSTGHSSRLNRLDKTAGFGSEEYSKEELVAEIGSATIMNSLGIQTEHSERNTVAYIQSWISVLKNDKKMIVSAAGKAEKAVNYIMNAEIAGA